jgi:cbb3-type cytochrome oxidase maturation protein
MEIVFILVPVSLIIVMLIIWAFVWAVKHDQFEDLEQESWRIILDEDDRSDS